MAAANTSTLTNSLTGPGDGTSTHERRFWLQWLINWAHSLYMDRTRFTTPRESRVGLGVMSHFALRCSLRVYTWRQSSRGVKGPGPMTLRQPAARHGGKARFDVELQLREHTFLDCTSSKTVRSRSAARRNWTDCCAVRLTTSPARSSWSPIRTGWSVLRKARLLLPSF